VLHGGSAARLPPSPHAARGVIARAHSWKGLAEEQPAAYKNVYEVVEVVHKANLAQKVARMRPIGVVKG
jgi:tRNA-splicing ligase RtcB